VYEEKALGIQESTEFDTAHGLEHLKQEEGYVGLHFKEQLAVSWLDRSCQQFAELTNIFGSVRCLVYHLHSLAQ